MPKYIARILCQSAGMVLCLLLVLCGSLAAQGELLSADTTAASADTMAHGGPQPGQINVDIGFNLKVKLRLIPVYAGQSLTDSIIKYLPQNSVVGVSEEQDNWYKIVFGPSDNRRNGWVISYGVERTHDMEYMVTGSEISQRWQGRKVEVLAGESAIRAFPNSEGQLLARVYRGEVFDIVSEAEQFYQVSLPSGATGWIWKGDVGFYIQPRYSLQQVQELRDAADRQEQRDRELSGLLGDLERRDSLARLDLNLLRTLTLRRQAERDSARMIQVRPSPWSYDSLKHRTSLVLGLRKQSFGSALGLASTMLKGIGVKVDLTPTLAFEFGRFSGVPTVSALGPDQEIPGPLTGLDTLNVEASLLSLGVAWKVNAAAVPILKKFDNHLHLGLGRMTLKATAAGKSRTDNLMGPMIGWTIGKHLFSRISFEAGASWIVTSTEVTGALETGGALLERQSKTSANMAIHGGVTWRF
ncbi:SH3 domain-containing protein [bacterium]|nr:SH3 domain-containing protein [bacterium]